MNATAAFDPKPAATRFADAWRNGKVIERLPEAERPRDLAEGYAIQDALLPLLGEAQAGYKLGMSSVAGMRATGLGRPARGFMTRPRIHADGARVTLAPGGKILYELEVCFVLGDRIPAGAPVAEKLASLARAHVGIELVASRLANRMVDGFPGLFGDDIGFHGYILGPEIPRAAWPAAFGAEATVTVDGKTLCTNAAGEARTDPVEALSMFLDDAAKAGLPLAPGMLVTTGSLVVPAESAATGPVVGRLGDLTVACTVGP